MNGTEHLMEVRYPQTPIITYWILGQKLPNSKVTSQLLETNENLPQNISTT